MVCSMTWLKSMSSLVPILLSRGAITSAIQNMGQSSPIMRVDTAFTNQPRRGDSCGCVLTTFPWISPDGISICEMVSQVITGLLPGSRWANRLISTDRFAVTALDTQ